MKARVFPILVSAVLTALFYSCGEDTPPEKTDGRITIVITEENTLETLSGVSVQLFSDDDSSVTPADRTDNSGRCTFSNIPIGSYHMNLSKPGYESKEGLQAELLEVKKAKNVEEEGYFIRDKIIPQMDKLRSFADKAEELTAEKYWPYPTYGDLLFGVK